MHSIADRIAKLLEYAYSWRISDRIKNTLVKHTIRKIPVAMRDPRRVKKAKPKSKNFEKTKARICTTSSAKSHSHQEITSDHPTTKPIDNTEYRVK